MSFINPQHRYGCFRCGLTDRVEKAEVSGRVEPPHLPSFDAPLVYESSWGCVEVGYVVACFVVFLLLLVAYIAIAFSSRGDPQGILPPLLIFFILTIIAVLITIRHAQKAKNDQIEVDRNNAERLDYIESSQKLYNHKKGIYDQLYYCGRDNVVFILEKPETCVPASEVEYLYETF
jgi:hypothetical protein